jgi:hypothetical protein
MIEYKGYLILCKALKVYPDSTYWCSQGDVFSDELGGSILIKRPVCPLRRFTDLNVPRHLKSAIKQDRSEMPIYKGP